MGLELLEPLKAYDLQYKEQHHQNVEKFFDELTGKSQVNPDENKKLVSAYEKAKKNYEDCRSKLKGKKVLRAFVIFGFIMCFAVALIGLIMLVTKQNMSIVAPILMMVLGILFGILLILLMVKVINPKINDLDRLSKQLKEIMDNALQACWDNMAPLNALYSDNMASQLFSTTLPIVQLDQYFNIKRYEHLVHYYNMAENENPCESAVFCQTGTILGNPIMLCKKFNTYMGTYTYEGTLTITWTTHDKNGTHHHSQTLRATVTKPKPYYNYYTYLAYGNDAAPNLTFSRKPSNASGKSEKQIEKMVKKQTKKLEKKALHDLMDDDDTTNYTRFGNDEFESLFGGENRNNDVEFNLLFTPLSQKAELALIKSVKPFGDDFFFDKQKKLNYIQSYHSQRFNYDQDARMFFNYDYEKARAKFINYNDNYFTNLYFDLAPLFAIPLYQQHKSLEYIYKGIFKNMVSPFEYEIFANNLNPDYFKHPNSRTDAILKANYYRTEANVDIVAITAHSYYTVEHVEYVSKHGGDGHWHDVPVHWLEYIPITNTKFIAVAKDESFKGKEANMDYLKKISRVFLARRGISCFLLDNDTINTSALEETLDKNEALEKTLQQIDDLLKNIKI